MKEMALLVFAYNALVPPKRELVSPRSAQMEQPWVCVCVCLCAFVCVCVCVCVCVRARAYACIRMLSSNALVNNQYFPPNWLPACVCWSASVVSAKH